MFHCFPRAYTLRALRCRRGRCRIESRAFRRASPGAAESPSQSDRDRGWWNAAVAHGRFPFRRPASQDGRALLASFDRGRANVVSSVPHSTDKSINFPSCWGQTTSGLSTGFPGPSGPRGRPNRFQDWLVHLLRVETRARGVGFHDRDAGNERLIALTLLLQLLR